MPLTFPSHLAPVLPLKLWRPRWFDGVALATGAVAPDVAYLVAGSDGRTFADTHAWPALFWWCLPVALGYAWVFRSSIATVAAQLPPSRRFGWPRYGSLAGRRHRWWITVSSALLGAGSHLAWDWLTHTDDWLSVVFGVRWSSVTDLPWWTVSDLTSTLLGAAVVLWCAARLPRRLAPCAQAPAAVPRRPVLFWSSAGAVAVVGLLTVPLLPGASLPAPTGVRLIHLAGLALLAGGLAVRARPPGPAG
ncbi:DUF4184 family protein [Micromonospora radicis]|uniref:DUF4184 family protein n=1 Tax=Micromonospora radicis TaxID=1894971 RepID=A0A418MWB4_9ACTN|nr:DUF4184 family protein [Micromonospora radicis]RIV39175.1 DUF4184 family protein [Micromonospora radicis]